MNDPLSKNKVQRKKSRVRKLSQLENVENSRYKYISKVGAELAPGVTLVNEMKIGQEEPLIVRAHPSGIQWIIGYNTGKIRIFDLTLEKPHDEPGTQFDHATILPPSPTESDRHIVTDIRFFHLRVFPDNSTVQKVPQNVKMVVAYATGVIRVIEYKCRNPCVSAILNEIQEESAHDLNENFNSVLCTSISYDNERIVTGGSDSNIRVYDNNLEQLLICRQSDLPDAMDGHAMRVLAVAYHPLGMTKGEYQHTFLSGGWDDTVMIWDDRKGQSIFQYHGSHICSNDALDIEPVNNLLLTANWSRDKPMFFIYRFNSMVVSDTQYESHDLEKEYSSPITSFLPDPHHQVNCMAYVGKWLSPETILIAGGNDPTLLILTKDRSEILSSVTAFDNSIIAADFRKKSKGGVHLCLCCGDTLLSLVIDKSAITKKKR